MTTNNGTLEVKVCRACNRCQERNSRIRERLARYNLTFAIASKKLCEVCKGGS